MDGEDYITHTPTDAESINWPLVKCTVYSCFYRKMAEMSSLNKEQQMNSHGNQKKKKKCVKYVCAVVILWLIHTPDGHEVDELLKTNW